jgi:general secretion pathway protein J
MSERRQGGFTLVEVLVATAILASITALIWGSFHSASGSKQRVEAIGSRYHQIRMAMNRMAKEISMTFLSTHDDPNTNRPRTFFIVEKDSRGDYLMFSSLAHQRLNEDAKECDQSVISYYLAPDPDDKAVMNLMRRETRRLGVERPKEDGQAHILLEDVKRLEFAFFDDRPEKNDWIESWDTQKVDGQPNRLPAKVRILVTLEDEYGRDITLRTATRTFLREGLWFQPGS